MDYGRAVELTRHNSGKHFLDSGSAYGRAWQQQPDEEGEELIIDPAISELYDCFISTNQLLVDTFEEHELLSALLEILKKVEPELSWFELGNKLMKDLGYVQAARDNTYNSENDLSQAMVWEVWTAPDYGEDWVYKSDSSEFGYAPEVPDWAECVRPEDEDWDLPRACSIVYVHTGCDIRGGYAPPAIGHFCGEYNFPFDLCVEFHLTAVEEDNEEAVDKAEEFNNSGYGTCGYSQCPSHYLAYTLDMQTIEWCADKKAFLVVWDNERFYACPCRPYMGE